MSEDHVLESQLDLDSMSMEEIIEGATLRVGSIDEISGDAVGDVLKKYTFAIVKGLISPDVVRAARRRIDAWYDPERIRPATGEHPREVMNIFHKLSIGGAEHSGVYRPRCMGTIYNPVWSEDVFGLREAFRVTAQLRNVLYGFPQNFAIEAVEDGFWTAARIHHYPAGGGFLVSHLDNIVPSVQAKAGLSNQYFQPVIVLSKKGKGEDCDFETGGGFFKVGSRRYFYEETCELGDIVIYSGATIHGVIDIDLHKTMNTDSAAGRLGGFVTLYKEFKEKNEVLEYADTDAEAITL